MYFINKIRDLTAAKKCSIFVDMDGVITDFNFLQPLDFKIKRPLFTNINTFKAISQLDNVKLYILSICRKDEQIIEKNEWLDKYAPFFSKEKRIIISKETNPHLSSKELKAKVLYEYVHQLNEEQIIVIDDDNEMLQYLSKKFNDIILFQDSSIID
jgi:hypothetical protein